MTTVRVPSPILPLTSVRFFAASYIVLLHSFLWTNHLYTSTWTGRFIRNGYVAVGFFFVLSGYILAHVHLNIDRPLQRKKFWISRFARIYPLLFVSLLIDIPIFFSTRLDSYGHDHLWKTILRTLIMFLSEAALLQAWWNTHFLGLNGPSWSLSAEAFFYLLFPFVAFRIWKWSRAAGGLAILYLWGCAMFFPLVVTLLRPALFSQIETSGLQWTIVLTPIFRIFEFLAGIALCSLQRDFSKSFTPQVRNQFGYLAIGTGLALFILTIEVANHIPFMAMYNGFLLPVYALVIFGLVNIRGWLASMLSHKLMVILGESSYAIYLLHDPIWDYFSRLRWENTTLLWILYPATVLFVSIGVFFGLERPARRMLLDRANIKPSVIQEQERVALAPPI